MSIKTGILKPYIEFLRIKDWWYLNGIFILGVTCAGSLAGKNLLKGLLVSSLCFAYGYSLNEYFDNSKKHVSGSRRFNGILYKLTPCISLGLALYFAYFISKILFLTVISVGIISWLYSAPPFRLKKHIFLRLFLSPLGYSLFFLLGAGLDKRLSSQEFFMYIYILLFYIPVELMHMLSHIDVDKAAGTPTLPLVYGTRKTMVLMLLLFIILALYSCLLYIAGVMSVYFLLWTLATWTAILVLLGRSYAQNNMEAFINMKLNARLVFSIYGTGLLVLFIRRI
ncbi:MAG: UbiA family prenyltransferase [Candidatus Omnitrophota bacterium]